MILAVEADAFLEVVDFLDLCDLEVVELVGLGLGWQEVTVEESCVFVWMKASMSSFLDRERRRSFSWAGGSGGRGWERRRSRVSVGGIDD